MKRTCDHIFASAVLAGVAWLGFASMARAEGSYSASVAGRYHAENPAVPDVPYGDGDWSTVIGLEAHEGKAYWQLAVDLATGADLNSDISLMTTPQLNLMFVDRSVVGGLGILSTYVQDDELGDEWTDLYYQFALGFEFPMGRTMSLTALAHYVFGDWDKLDDFEFGDLDYSAGLRYRF